MRVCRQYYWQCSTHSSLTTVSVDTRLWKTKHPRKRFQNFRQSCVLLTDRIEMHQSQPDSMTWRRLGHTITSGCNWWISIRCQLHARLTEILETFSLVFCFSKSYINGNNGGKGIISPLLAWFWKSQKTYIDFWKLNNNGFIL